MIYRRGNFDPFSGGHSLFDTPATFFALKHIKYNNDDATFSIKFLETFWRVVKQSFRKIGANADELFYFEVRGQGFRHFFEKSSYTAPFDTEV